MIVGISPYIRSDIVMVARIATIRPGARGRVPPGPALSSIRRSNILMINIMTIRPFLTRRSVSSLVSIMSIISAPFLFFD